MTVLTILALALRPATATPERFPLEGTWRLTQSEKKISIPAQVPGLVQTDLMKAGKLADPFYRDQDKAAQWVGALPWTYSRSFTLSADYLRRPHVVLRCDGLDALAHVRLNGKRVADPDNMFRTWEFDVRPLLRVGENRIEISFDPIEPFLEAHVNQLLFPGKPVQVHGWGYVRKPPFLQGWDFSPRLLTSGIWKGIGLVAWDQARLTDIRIDQNHDTPGKVGINIEVSAQTSQTLTARTVVTFEGQKVAQSDSVLRDGTAKARLDIRNPHLWWPRGLGSPDLYNVQIELRDSRGRVVDRDSKRIGLRTITWIAKTSTTPLTLAVNGHRFFAKGSNWVPRDALFTRATAAEERRMVDEAVSANMNMLRLWGGGHYESDAFFDECDRQGLLVWFEFKFADATYPSFDPTWLANVRAEAEDNVRRVRSHPCVAVWSGNNEVIGFIADHTQPDHMSREDYNKLFHIELANVVHRLAPGSNYTPGSPEIGDEHDWNVWHGSSGFESYRDVHGFLSEFGFQAFPVPQSVAKFTAQNDRTTVLSPVMKNHQRNWRDGNQLILTILKRYYRKPKDFDSTLWLSQIQQAEGVLTGVEHWRRDWPRSTGSLVWQFNDCWPSISWAMVDYYGQPKALFYRLRHAYAPIMLSGVANANGIADLWIANDRREARRATVEWTVLRTDGKILTHGNREVDVPAGTSSVRAVTLDGRPFVQREGAGNILIWAKLTAPGESLSSAVLTFTRAKDLNLANPGLKASVNSSPGGYEVTITSRRPALWCWVEVAGIEAKYSDNFIHIRPGEPAKVFIQTTEKTNIAQIERSLRVRSLFDTYRIGDDYRVPITRVGVDGTITATAENADILGDAAILETGNPGNIGNWSNMHDRLQWTVENAQPGTYSLVVNLSSPPNGGGSKFQVEVDGQILNGTVPETSSWTTYKDVDLGTVHIAKAGRLKITLTPLNKVTTHVMNLRRITLRHI